VGAALPLGWAATAHPFRAADPMAVSDPDLDRVFVRPEGEAGVAAARLASPCCVQDQQDNHADRPNCRP
jgi:hypothetical protein